MHSHGREKTRHSSTRMRQNGEGRAEPVVLQAGLEVCCMCGIFHRDSHGEKSDMVRISHAGYPAVWEAVTRIPRGRVATYGMVAAMCGRPGQGRFVGYALHRLPPGSDIPWHRVINARGEISLKGAPAAAQKALLEREGVVVRGSRVDLARFGIIRPRKLAGRGCNKSSPRASNR